MIDDQKKRMYVCAVFKMYVFLKAASKGNYLKALRVEKPLLLQFILLFCLPLS